jgi:saccharopine dehydrogenase-like NADP-dependent oxidoreductase
MSRRILVLGIDRAIGRCVSTALAADPSIECIVGGHHSGNLAAHKKLQAYAEQIGARVSAANVADGILMREALEGVFAVVNATALDRHSSYGLARQCARHGAHYVGLASEREHVTGVKTLHRHAEAAACQLVTGANAVPAISGALVDSLAHEFDRLDEIHVALSPFNGNQPWFVTMRALTARIGRPIRVRRNGRWRVAYGWSEPEKVAFPEPVGSMRAYLCDAPDLDLFPHRYRAGTVTFRVGLSRAWWSYALAALGRYRRRRYLAEQAQRNPGSVDGRDGLQNLVDKTASIQVRVRGQCDGAEVVHSACLIARNDSGAAIASSPAIVLVKRWVREGVTEPGAVPCLGLLSLEAIKAGLLGHDIVLVRS